LANEQITFLYFSTSLTIETKSVAFSTDKIIQNSICDKIKDTLKFGNAAGIYFITVYLFLYYLRWETNINL